MLNRLKVAGELLSLGESELQKRVSASQHISLDNLFQVVYLEFHLIQLVVQSFLFELPRRDELLDLHEVLQKLIQALTFLEKRFDGFLAL